MIDRYTISSCICITGTIVGIIGIPITIVGVINLPTTLSAEETRTLNIQQQTALLNQKTFNSEGWKYCLTGFSFIGVGIVSIGCILTYLCILRIRFPVVPDIPNVTLPTRVLGATSPPPTHSSSTNGALPPTSAANVPVIFLESLV